jgi:polyisoprenoid-binding protein YceI
MNSSVRYVLDARASQLTVLACASGLAVGAAQNHRFAIREFSGEARLVPASFGAAAVHMTIRPQSLELLETVSESDRQAICNTVFQELLEVRNHPRIDFRSTEVLTMRMSVNMFHARIRGALSFRGVTNAHSFVAQAVVGEDTLRAFGDFTLKPTDYRIPMAIGACGTLNWKNELKFAFFILARKQE